MDNLPQEIINRIAPFLERYPEQHGVAIIQQQSRRASELPAYATISKQWKEAVEYLTFRQLKIRSDDLEQLEALVINSRRRYLKRLSYTILLREFPKEKCRQTESQDERESNNEAYTQGIINLFNILTQWDAAGLLSGLRLKIEDPECPNNGPESKRRWESSYLTLSGTDGIPTVSGVTYLNVKGNYRRMTSPAVAPALAALLPDLKQLYAEFVEYGEQAVQIRNRAEFAKLLERAKLSHVSSAKFDFHQEPHEDHGVSSPSVLPSGALYDPFSASLRVFSQHLTSFTLSGYVDSTLFWPSDHETCSTPSWPSLKRLNIFFNAAAPSGDWYYVGTPGDNEEQFLEHGNTKTLGPFLTSFAKAVKKMPVLEYFMLECEIGYEYGFWEISYYAPGVKADWDDVDQNVVDVRRLYYSVGEVWRPDDFVAEVLRSLGQERHGSELIERFLEPRTWAHRSPWSWL
ncbi:hypothetical protein FB567DRAFT_34823 [Paraphoma chrysanthemicola]|uniref:F-box domain-containing protein n=1 Tax=Paraphoma chrysanthemicola TaxID=798071 RepID=A0A8K0W4E8_9PLEO|nr:hypothetical protein FB567DRAFT_34823 [Paraphoma chrysanthemicola]